MNPPAYCRPAVYTVQRALRTVARSVRALHAIHDPHIIRVTDSAEAQFADCATSYLAMEFVEGVQLDEWSRRLDGIDGDDPNAAGADHAAAAFANRLVMAHTLALALAKAHTARYIDDVGLEAHGVLHGDLKPANILVRPGGVPVVLDFLLIDIQRLLDPAVVPARLLAGEGDSGRITGAFGTPGFMAPEQERDGIITVKADIYGLGMTLVYLFLPVESNKLIELYQGSSPQIEPLRPLLLSMIDPDPRKRPDSMHSVADSLAATARALQIDLTGDEQSGKPPGIISRLRNLFARRGGR